MSGVNCNEALEQKASDSDSDASDEVAFSVYTVNENGGKIPP